MEDKDLIKILNSAVIKPRNQRLQQNLELVLKNLHQAQAAQGTPKAEIKPTKKFLSWDNFGWLKLQSGGLLAAGILVLFATTGVAAYVTSPSVKQDVAMALNIQQLSTIAVQSEPAGAKVLLNGHEIGTTPLITDYQVGEYKLTLELPDHELAEQTIALNADQRLDLSYNLLEVNPDIYADFKTQQLEREGIELRTAEGYQPISTGNMLDLRHNTKSSAASIVYRERAAAATDQKPAISIALPKNQFAASAPIAELANLNLAKQVNLDIFLPGGQVGSTTEYKLNSKQDRANLTEQLNSLLQEQKSLQAKLRTTSDADFKFTLGDYPKVLKQLEISGEISSPSKLTTAEVTAWIYSLASFKYDYSLDQKSPLLQADFVPLSTEGITASKYQQAAAGVTRLNDNSQVLIWPNARLLASSPSQKLLLIERAGRYYLAQGNGDKASQLFKLSALEVLAEIEKTLVLPENAFSPDEAQLVFGVRNQADSSISWQLLELATGKISGAGELDPALPLQWAQDSVTGSGFGFTQKKAVPTSSELPEIN
jgi:hypothetical protein